MIRSSGLSLCSVIVRTSASIWVGCQSSVSPLKTGTSPYAASSSTVAWLSPRYSMPSNIRPRTRAVSFTDSLWPIWEPVGSRYVVEAPWSAAATSKAQRVRVEVFSKISAMFRTAQPLHLGARPLAAFEPGGQLDQAAELRGL